MIKDKIILIDRPFAFVPTEPNLEFLIDVLKRLDVEVQRVKVFDLTTVEHR